MRAILITLFPLICFSQPGDLKSRYEVLTGEVPGTNSKQFWDKRYEKRQYVFGKAPARFLAENYHYIPKGGRVLDVGMGEGRHAVFLAQKSYNVVGVDISSVAVRKAKRLAKEFSVSIKTVISPMSDYSAPNNHYDAIICYYYVNRQLNNEFLKWLKPGGILIYEAFTTNQLKIKGFEKFDRQYLLRPGELLNMFPSMSILKYEEPLHENEFRASIILKKPSKKLKN